MTGRILGSDAAQATGRFDPNGIHGYRARSAPKAPLRATRAEAVDDERRYLDSRHAAKPVDGSGRLAPIEEGDS